MASMMAVPTPVMISSIGVLSAMAFLDPLGLVARFGVWKVLTVVFALLNLKNIPFVWHVCASLQLSH